MKMKKRRREKPQLCNSETIMVQMEMIKDKVLVSNQSEQEAQISNELSTRTIQVVYVITWQLYCKTNQVKSLQMEMPVRVIRVDHQNKTSTTFK